MLPERILSDEEARMILKRRAEEESVKREMRLYLNKQQNALLTSSPDKPKVALFHATLITGDRLQGTVYGHPTIGSGQFVTTSKVERIAGHLVETKNTIYILMEPATDTARSILRKLIWTDGPEAT